MTPEQQKAIILARARKRRAEAESAPAEPKKQELSWLDSLQGGLNTFARGASFGFADELAGAVSELTGGDYESAREDWNARQERFAEENPATAFGLELAGGIATAAPLGAAASGTKAAQAASRLPTWARLAGAGGASGAVYGAGTAEPGERVEGALVGGALGAATGVVLPPAARLAGRGLKRAGRAVGRGVKAVTEAGSASPNRAGKKIAQAISRDQLTPEQVQANMRKLGPQGMLVDAGEENLRGLGEAATSIPGRAKNVGRSALDNRAKGAQERIVKAITKTLGVDDVDFDKATLSLHDNMRQIAKNEGYDEILNAGIVRMDDELKKMAEGSTMKRALAQAYSILDDDIALGRADAKLREFFTFTNPKTGQTMEVPALIAQFSDDTLKPSGAKFDPANYSKVSEPTLRVWDYVKRGLDSVISDGTDPVTGKLSSQAERAAAFKRSLIKKLDDASPDYARVRGLYADEKSAESALNMGRKFMRDDAEVTARRLADMSEAEKNFFRLGAARELHDKVKSGVDTGMAWRQIVKKPLIREKIEKLFPDRKARAEFMREMERELRFAETNSAVNPASNSATARRAAQQADMAMSPELVNAVPDVVTGNTRGLMARALRAAGDKFGSGMPENVRNDLAEALFSNDPERLQAMIQALKARPEFNRMPPPGRLPSWSALLSGQAGAMAGD